MSTSGKAEVKESVTYTVSESKSSDGGSSKSYSETHTKETSYSETSTSGKLSLGGGVGSIFGQISYGGS